jgi:hypothetical protein
MSKPKAPTPPDPYKTADAQTGSSLMTALMNNQMGMVDQVGPNGSLRYTQTGEQAFTDPTTGRAYTVPRYQATTELSQSGQQIQNANDRSATNLANLGAEQSARLSELLGRPVDMSGVPGMADRSGERPAQYGADLAAPSYDRLSGDAGLTTGYQNDFSADRKRVEDALFERLNPQLDRSRSNLETSLANRGIKLGSSAYDRALEESNKAANDARVSTVLAGGQEQSRLTDLARQEAEFGNNARQQTYTNQAQQTAFNNATGSQSFADQQAIQGRQDVNANNQFSQRQQIADALDRQHAQGMNEKFAVRNQPLQELLAILNGTNVENPNFALATPDRMATTDMAGLINQGYGQQQQNYQNQLASNNAMMSGLFGLGSSAIAASNPLGSLFGLGKAVK